MYLATYSIPIMQTRIYFYWTCWVAHEFMVDLVCLGWFYEPFSTHGKDLARKNAISLSSFDYRTVPPVKSTLIASIFVSNRNQIL